MTERSLQIVFIPGLSEALLDGGTMPRLAKAAGEGRRARLVCSFPCLPTVVEQTVLTGVQPGDHGVLGRHALTHAPGPAPPSGLPQRVQKAIADATSGEVERSLRCFRREELAVALMEKGLSAEARLEAARAIDDDLANVVETADAAHAVLVCGGPGFLPTRATVDLSALLAAEPSLRVKLEGAVARIQSPPERLAIVRDRLLAQPGIERVLSAKGLQLWGARHPQAGHALALAERAWSFEPGAASCGHPEVDGPNRPVVLALGGANEGPWPAEVHDYRLAPTAASFLHLPQEGFLDTALAL